MPVALSFRQREEANRLAKRLNARLTAEETRLLRIVEVLTAMTWLSGFVFLLLLWLQFAMIPHGWIALAVYSLLCLAFRQVLRRRWAANRFIQLFRKEVEPQIQQFTLQTGLPRWQFDQMVSYVIADDDPLRRFLKVRPAASDLEKNKKEKSR